MPWAVRAWACRPSEGASTQESWARGLRPRSHPAGSWLLSREGEANGGRWDSDLLWLQRHSHAEAPFPGPRDLPRTPETQEDTARGRAVPGCEDAAGARGRCRRGLTVTETDRQTDSTITAASGQRGACR